MLVSMAYVETDMRTVLEKAMRAIPMDSEFYTVLEFAFEACEKSATYREAWELCEEKYKHYNWVHCYPNMASEVIAIYFAGNDYQKAMSILMMSGQDNDCTGGPIGARLRRDARDGGARQKVHRAARGPGWTPTCARWRPRASPPFRKRRPTRS